MFATTYEKNLLLSFILFHPLPLSLSLPLEERRSPTTRVKAPPSLPNQLGTPRLRKRQKRDRETERERNLSEASRANETRVRALFVHIGSELLARVNRWVTRETSHAELSRRFSSDNFDLITRRNASTGRGKEEKEIFFFLG